MEKDNLFGSIYRTCANSKNEAGNDFFRNEKLDITLGRIEVFNTNKKYYYDDRRKIFCTYLGYINNLEEIRYKYSIDDTSVNEVIFKLYNKKGISYLSNLDGVFLIFLFDEINDIGYLYQSIHGMSLPIYYYSTNEKFVFSTSLKPILKHLDKREMDFSAAKDFIHFQLSIPTEKTLLRNVYKVLPGKFLIIDNKNKINITKKINYNWIGVPRRYAKVNLINSVKDNFTKLIKSIDIEKLAVTHTKGWDTNLLLFFTNEFSHKTINTITINGGEAVNEVPFTKEIQKYYSNINSITGDVENNINQLINMAWIYEGYVFEEGFFLRYKLSEILRNENITSVFLGACADQILFPQKGIRKIIRTYPDIGYIIEYILRRHCTKERVLRKRMKRTVHKVNFNLAIDMLLKMHGVALNYHGIQGLYPYVNRKTEILSGSLGWLNYKKKFYKMKVKDILPKEIVTHISKSGNTVDTKKLFQIEDNLLMQVINSKVITEILNKSQRKQIISQPNDYHTLILQLIYIYLINELFISGKFDNELKEFYPNLNMKDFF